MTREEAKSCIGTIEMLQRLAFNIHGVVDVIDADNCKKIIKALEQEPVLDKIRAEIIKYEGDCRLSVDEYPSCKQCTDNVFESIYGILDKYKAEVKGEEPEK